MLIELLLLGHETKKDYLPIGEIQVKMFRNGTYFTISFYNASNEERKQLLKGKSSF